MKLFNKIGIMAALFTLCSCGSDEVPGETPVEGKEVTVFLKFNGEITSSESPLTRASGNDLYGIQVYKNGSAYAYGLFDDVDKIKINLHEGNAYKFIVLLVKDGKNLVYCNISGYFEPFENSYSNSLKVTNYFTTSSSTNCTKNFQKGYMVDKDYNSMEYPEAHFYYGELDNYFPTVNGTVDIELKHTVFGLRCEVSGITDGTVSVSIKNSTRTFFENTAITEDFVSDEAIFAFYDTYSAWLYADSYTENLTVSVSWLRGVGVTQDLGSKSIQVKRNTMNVVRIQLGSDDGDAGVGITTEEETDMTEEEVDITLE